MYLPPSFAETNLAKLHDFVEQHSFGLLVTQIGDEPFATHLPLLIDRQAGPRGALLGHVAKANPHWRHLAGRTSLAVFSGPHAYISPTWYEASQVVPTWNYVAVHAYGVAEIIERKADLVETLRATVAYYEQPLAQPWSFAGEEEFVDRLADQIVGFRLPIERIEGKWKLNQNHRPERREKVINALERQINENSVGIASLMRQTLNSR